MHCCWLVSQFSSALTFSVLGLSVNGSRNSSSDWPLSIWRSGRTKDRKRKTTTTNATSMTIAICTGAAGLTFGTTNSLLGFGARELCGQLTALGLGSSCFTNQVAAKNRLIGERVLQSRGELDGVASP